MDVGSVADVSEVHAASVFSVEVSRGQAITSSLKMEAARVYGHVHTVPRSGIRTNTKYSFGFRGSTASCAEAFTTFRRPLHLHTRPVLNIAALFAHYLTR
jgi:hypothetical protein